MVFDIYKNNVLTIVFYLSKFHCKDYFFIIILLCHVRVIVFEICRVPVFRHVVSLCPCMRPFFLAYKNIDSRKSDGIMLSLGGGRCL